jgi:hypothetical protein
MFVCLCGRLRIGLGFFFLRSLPSFHQIFEDRIRAFLLETSNHERQRTFSLSDSLLMHDHIVTPRVVRGAALRSCCQKPCSMMDGKRDLVGHQSACRSALITAHMA